MQTKGVIIDALWEPKKDYELTGFEKTTSKAKNGNQVWKNPNASIKKIELSELSPSQVLIKVKSCGICGSDVHFYETDKDGYMRYPGLTKFPNIIGHEFSGQIVDKGALVKQLEIDDFVTVEEMMWCGTCKNCRAGYPNQCINLEEIGFTVNGGMAEYIIVDEKYCWSINSLLNKYSDISMACDIGATVEPTSVAYNSIFIRGGGFLPGATFVVFGAGPIGLAGVQLARLAGASKTIIFDEIDSRVELAKKIGVDYAYNTHNLGGAVNEVINEITQGDGVDFILEAAGAPEVFIPESEKCIAVNGKYVQVGRANNKVSSYLEVLQVKAAQIIGAQGHSGSNIFPNVIKLMERGLIDNSKIITRRFRFEDSLLALEEAKKRVDGKIIIQMD